MAAAESEKSASVRIESAEPGANRLTVHVSPAVEEDLVRALEDGGGDVTRDIIELSVPDVAQSVLEVAGPIATSGALLVAALREWWHRNDGKKVTVTFNGEPISLAGMSTEEMAKIIDLARARWEERWREQFPDRFPGNRE